MDKVKCGLRTVLLEAMFVVLAVSSVTGLSNIFCNVPQEEVIAIDPPNHGYYPFFVKLHRCAGSNGLISPSVQKCVATRFTEFPLTVHSISSDEVRTVTLTNHTGCGAECVTRPTQCDLEVQDWNENTCSCVCKYPDGPPQHKTCKDGFRWSRHRCQCVCSKPQIICPIRQVWSSEVCGCTCEERVVKRCARKKMGLNIDDCSCVKVQASSNPIGAYTRDRMFITVLAGQSFIIIILICVLVHWIRKKRRSNPKDNVKRFDSLKSEDESPPRYSEVPMEVCSSESLEENSKEFDDSSCTVPLSPRMTNL